MNSAHENKLIGKQLCGYTITRAVSENGFWVVIIGRRDSDTGLETADEVCFKLLRATCRGEIVSRFDREMRRMRQLRNEPQRAEGGIAEWLFDVDGGEFSGEFAEFQAGFAMRAYASDLRQTMRIEMSPRQRLQLALGVAYGLAAAHSGGAPHRDLKPENILLDNELRPHLCDFGLAAAEPNTRLGDLTVQNEIMGTLNYMPPEQHFGLQGGSIRGDLYSLGVVLYELFAGSFPFCVETEQQLYEQKQRGVTKPPSQAADRRMASGEGKMWRGVDRICMNLLAPEASARPASAASVAQQLQRCLDGESVRYPSWRARRYLGWLRRHRVGLTLSGVLILLAILFTAAIGRGPTRAPEVGQQNARQIRDEHDAVLNAVVNPLNPDVIAYTIESGAIRIADRLGKTKFQAVLGGRFATRGRLAWSPTGDSILIGGVDGVVRNWHPEEQEADELYAHEFDLRDIAFSPNGKFVASIDRSGKAIAFDLSQRKEVATFQIAPRQEGSTSHGGSLIWVNNSTLLLRGGGWSDHLSLWNPWTDESVVVVEQGAVDFGVSAIAASPDGERFAVAMKTRSDLAGVRSRERAPWIEIRSLSAPHKASQQFEFIDMVHNLLWRDADELAVCTPNRIVVCDLDSDAKVSLPHDLTGLHVVDWTNTRLLARRAGQLQLFESDAVKHQLIMTVTPTPRASFSKVVSLGERFLSSDSTGSMRIWSADMRQATRLDDTAGIEDFAIDQASNLVATFTKGGQLRVWDLKSEQLLTSVRIDRDVSALDWAPGTQQLAVGAHGGELSIYEFEHGAGEAAEPRLVLKRRFSPSEFGLENFPRRSWLSPVRWKSDREVLVGVGLESDHGQLWSASLSGAPIRNPDRTSAGARTIASNIHAILPTPTGAAIVGSHYGYVSHLGGQAGPQGFCLGGPYAAARDAVLLDDKRAAFAFSDGSVHVWRFQQDKHSCVLPKDGVYQAALVMDARRNRLISIDILGRIHVFDASDLSEIHRGVVQGLRPSSAAVHENGDIAIVGGKGRVCLIDGDTFALKSNRYLRLDGTVYDQP